MTFIYLFVTAKGRKAVPPSNEPHDELVVFLLYILTEFSHQPTN